MTSYICPTIANKKMRLDILKNASEKLIKISEEINCKTEDIDVQIVTGELNVTLPGKIHKSNMKWAFIKIKEDEETKILKSLGFE